MEITILESRLIFDNNILQAVYVVWDRYGETRASYSGLKRMSGYHHLKEYDVFASLKLLQEVASGGRCLTKKENALYFPNHKIESNE